MTRPIMLLSLCLLSPLMAQEQKPLDPSTPELSQEEAAEIYRNVHEMLMHFSKTFEHANAGYTRFDQWLYPDRANITLTPEEKERVRAFAEDFFFAIEETTQMPVVHWSFVETLIERGPTEAEQPYSPAKIAMNSGLFARKYAYTFYKDEPQATLDAVFKATTLGRHLNSEPQIPTHMMMLASDAMAMQTLASLAPAMDSQSRRTLRVRWQELPSTGNLIGCLGYERDFFLPWLKSTLLQEAALWAEAHNETLDPNEIPWAVLKAMFEQDLRAYKKLITAKHYLMRRSSRWRYWSAGIKPMHVIKQIDQATAAYSELINLVQTAPFEVDTWLKENKYHKNIFLKPFGENLSTIIDEDYRRNLMEAAFFFGLDILDHAVEHPKHDSVVRYGDAWLRYQELQGGGFRISLTWKVDTNAEPDTIAHLDFAKNP